MRIDIPLILFSAAILPGCTSTEGAASAETPASTLTAAQPEIAVPTPTPASESYDNFYYADFIPEALASQPNREKELAFAKACRANLMSEFHRGKSNRDFIDEFVRNFDRTKISDATRLVVIRLVERQADAARLEDLKLANLLYSQLKPTSPEEQAFGLALRSEIARRWCFDYGFDAELKKLFDLIAKDPQAPWLMKRPMLAMFLFSQFERSVLISNIPNATQAKLTREFSERLEKIPPEKRGFPVSNYLGFRHLLLAWIERGGAWANLTSEKQFEGFNKHLVIAARELLRAHQLDPKRIEPIRRLMDIAMADSKLAGGDVGYWLKKARECPGFGPEILYIAAFSSAARWCGDTDIILRACDELIAYGYDTDGPFRAHDTFLQFLIDVPEDKQEWYKDAVARRLVQIGNGYLKRDFETKTPSIGGDGIPFDFRLIITNKLFDLDRIGYASQLISVPALPKREESNEYPVWAFRNHSYLRKLVAIESGDKSTLDDIFPFLPYALTFTLDDEKHDRIIAEKRIQHADAVWLKSADERLVALDKNLRSEDTRSYLKALRQLLAMETGVMNGEKITLPFTPALWDKAYGKWTFKGADAEVEMITITPGFHEALSLGWFRPPYEITLRTKRSWSGPGAKVGVTIGRLPGWNQPPRPAPGCSFLRQHACRECPHRDGGMTPSLRASSPLETTRHSRVGVSFPMTHPSFEDLKRKSFPPTRRPGCNPPRKSPPLQPSKRRSSHGEVTGKGRACSPSAPG
jgi:hypothetical protein